MRRGEDRVIGHKYECSRCNNLCVFPDDFRCDSSYYDNYTRQCKRCYNEEAKVWSKQNPRKSRIIHKRKHALKNGIEFAIDVDDVAWPTHCPVFGIELDYEGTGKVHKASPSFDRLDPSKGYVPGNVIIISQKANSIKQDATADDIRAVADWLDRMK